MKKPTYCYRLRYAARVQYPAGFTEDEAVSSAVHHQLQLTTNGEVDLVTSVTGGKDTGWLIDMVCYTDILANYDSEAITEVEHAQYMAGNDIIEQTIIVDKHPNQEEQDNADDNR